jgi:hypothetical protein
MHGIALALLADDLRSTPAYAPGARFWCVLLASLLAATAPSATALCLQDSEGGCGTFRHDIVVEIHDGDCPEGARLCIIDIDGSLANAPNDALLNLTVRNLSSSAITVELRTLGRFSDADTSDGERRHASTLLASLEVPASESRSAHDIRVDGDISHVRLQGMTADGRQAEVDHELLNVRIFAMGPGEPEPAGPQDDEVDAVDGKDASAAPAALLLMAVLGALLVARKSK